MSRELSPTRAERLAAKLRENLRRRKIQARALDAEPPGGTAGHRAEPDGEGLSKAPPTR